ncbi:MAG: hypothetical protein JXR79_04120 [Nitrospirae bacterium]|nr:hypothetical protein [Nitrospirota bacterium]
MANRTILDVIKTAVTAPSSWNCQPWRFEVKGNVIKILNLSDRDASLYNYLQRSSLLAHGALIENVILTSKATGFDPELRLFPDKKRPNLIAELELLAGTPKKDPLFEFIPKRTTNRKPYSAAALSSKEKNSLLNQAFWFPHLSFKIADTDEKKEELSSIIGFNNSICLRNRALHKSLFENMRWTKNEAEQSKDGLYIKNLGLSYIEQMILRTVKTWSMANLMNKLGLSTIASIKGRKLCSSSAAICIITAPDDSALNFIDSGRLMQRLSLDAARMGLSAQIETGSAMLIQRILADAYDGISKSEAKDVMHHYKILKSVFNLSEDTIMLFLRIGRSEHSASTSLRKTAEEITTAL